jgi:aspartate kinase
MNVFKFGGASVNSASAIAHLANIVMNFKDNMVVVVSAFGKTTNLLESLWTCYLRGDENKKTIFQEFRDYHMNIARELFPDKNHPVYTELKTEFDDLEKAIHRNPSLDQDFEYDKIVSYGEILSSRIVSAYLNHFGIPSFWIDIRECLKTDDTFREARIDWKLSTRLIQQTFSFENHSLYLTQGFIGATPYNLSTTLGREGSDFSAAVLAYILDAKEVTIWKDVPGILSADPKWYRDPEKLNEISYTEAIELAYYGANVIHPKTIKPLQNKKIPLFVKPFLHPEEKGTIIHEVTEKINIPPIYILKKNQVLISISPKDFSFIVEENLSTIFSLLAKYRIKVNLMENSAIRFSVVVDNHAEKVQLLIDELKSHFKVLYNQDLEVITIRHYTKEAIDKMTSGRDVMVQQKSRRTARIVVK